MFSYCQNNPTNNADASGCIPVAVGIGVAIAGIAVGALAIHSIAKTGSQLLGSIISNVNYRNKESIPRTIVAAAAKSIIDVYDYSRSIANALTAAKEKTPHVHHIVPVGKFSTRSATTRGQIEEMHAILSDAGINRYIDPMNLVLVSAKTHAHLHTDAYINHVHSYITAAGSDKQEIYKALFALRIEIAAWDIHALGY